jgi:hypothetical protein
MDLFRNLSEKLVLYLNSSYNGVFMELSRKHVRFPTTLLESIYLMNLWNQRLVASIFQYSSFIEDPFFNL